jgi:hypothetical protein
MLAPSKTLALRRGSTAGMIAPKRPPAHSVKCKLFAVKVLPCLKIIDASSEILDLLNHQFRGLMGLSPLSTEGSQAVVTAFERSPHKREIEPHASFDYEGKITRVLGFKVLGGTTPLL